MASKYDFILDEVYVFTAEEVASEVWRVIPGWSRYIISNLGRVRNQLTGRWIKWHPSLSRDGRTIYWRVMLSRRRADGTPERKPFSVNRAVAAAYLVNPDPERKTHVHHIDNNPGNNRLTNVMYVTPAENAWLKTHDTLDGFSEPIPETWEDYDEGPDEAPF